MKKTLTMVLAMVLVAAISVSATLAYLTSKTEVVNNTFTVGNVKITLDEAPVEPYGTVVAGDRVTANQYKLIPGHHYAKDPTVHVDANSEKAWLFVKVDNGIAGIEAEGNTTIAAQMAANGWTEVVDGVYAYEHIVEGGANVNVFSTFDIAGDADVEANKDKAITIQAYAIQADGFTTAAAAWEAAPATWGANN